MCKIRKSDVHHKHEIWCTAHLKNKYWNDSHNDVQYKYGK
jgi:hypothetical protein